MDGTVYEQTLIPERGVCDHSVRAQDMHNRGEGIEGYYWSLRLTLSGTTILGRTPDPTLHPYLQAEGVSHQSPLCMLSYLALETSFPPQG